MDPRGVEANGATARGTPTPSFRWTLVGLKLELGDVRFTFGRMFQMDPRGVEAWVPDPGANAVKPFQMDPRGVEAYLGRSPV